MPNTTASREATKNANRKPIERAIAHLRAVVEICPANELALLEHATSALDLLRSLDDSGRDYADPRANIAHTAFAALNRFHPLSSDTAPEVM